MAESLDSLYLARWRKEWRVEFEFQIQTFPPFLSRQLGSIKACNLIFESLLMNEKSFSAENSLYQRSLSLLGIRNP